MDERARIIELAKNGAITTDEAISLLEALSKEKAPQPEQQMKATQSTPTSVVDSVETPAQTVEPASVDPVKSSSNESQSEQAAFDEDGQQQKKTTGFEDIFGKAFNNKKMEQMFNDIREDVTEFSDRMMTFMNTTLSRVKSGEMPFGEKSEFEKTYAFPADDVKAFEIDIANGKVDFVQSEDGQVTVKAFVKMPLGKTDAEEAQSQFLESFVELKDGKIDINSPLKFSSVDLTISAPEKKYDVLIAKLLTGGVTLKNANAKLIKAKTYNGSVEYSGGKFEHADLQTVNGSIEVRFVEGEDLEATTANGRVYIDGKIKEVDAESVNGHVIITTSSRKARKVKATTLAGAVELYIPKTASLEGMAASNFGKVDVQLADAKAKSVDDQFLRKTIQFNKIVEDSTLLKVKGESRTGAVIVRYTIAVD